MASVTKFLALERDGPEEAIMWSQYYQSTISEILHKSLIRLCMEHVPYEDKLEIDGIVCISTGDSKQIVVKMHEIVDRAYRDVWQVSLREALLQESRSSSASPVPLKPKNSRKATIHVVDSHPAKRIRHDEVSKHAKEGSQGPELKNPGKENELLCDRQDVYPDSPRDKSQDSFEEMTCLNFRDYSPVTSMLAYRKRPQRQRVPLSEELDSPLTELACKQCPEKFVEFESLEKHNRDVHGRCTCRRCFNTFSLHCNLRRHERLHSGLKPFSCRVCQSAFSRNGDLRVHVGKHRGPQTCQLCSSLFQSAGELQNHDCPAEALFGDIKSEAKKDGTSEPTEDKAYSGSISETSDENYFDSAEPKLVVLDSGGLVEVIDDEETDHQMEWDRETDPQNPVNRMFQVADKQESKLAALLTSDADTAQSAPLQSESDIPSSKSTEIDPPEIGSTDSPLDHNTSMDMASLLLTLSTAINSSPLASINSSPLSQCVNENSQSQSVQENDVNSSHCRTPVPFPATPKSSKKSKSAKKKIQSISKIEPDSPTNSATPREHFCRDCGVQWPDFEVYETHCVERHVRFPCKYCEQTFSNKNNRGRHERTHTGHKQHICPDCGKCFTRSDTLKEHRITHTEVYFGNQCFCGAVIEKKSDLLAHVKKCLQKKKQTEKLTANLITPEDFRARLEAKNCRKSEPGSNSDNSRKIKSPTNASSPSPATQNYVIRNVGALSQIQHLPEKSVSLLKPLDLVKKEPGIDLHKSEKSTEDEDSEVPNEQQQSKKQEKGESIPILPLNLVKKDPDSEQQTLETECLPENQVSSPSSPMRISAPSGGGNVHIISSLLKKPFEENANEIHINSNLLNDHGDIMEENGNVKHVNGNSGDMKKAGIVNATSVETNSSGELESNTVA